MPSRLAGGPRPHLLWLWSYPNPNPNPNPNPHQVRDIITIGIKRLQKMGSKKERFKAASISGAGKVVRAANFGRCGHEP